MRNPPKRSKGAGAPRVLFSHSDIEEEEAEANLLRIFEYILFFNSDRTPFYNDAPPRDTPDNLT